MTKFMACYMGSATAPGAPPTPDVIQKGMAAWQKWMEDNAAVIVDAGGPLGTTKKVGPDGVSDIRNLLGGYVVIEATDQESAAKLFLDHPHFSIFPGDSVEVMQVMPIPGS